MQLVGFIIRIYHDALSSERQIVTGRPRYHLPLYRSIFLYAL